MNLFGIELKGANAYSQQNERHKESKENGERASRISVGQSILIVGFTHLNSNDDEGIGEANKMQQEHYIAYNNQTILK